MGKINKTIKEKVKKYFVASKMFTGKLICNLQLIINKLKKINIKINDFWFIPLITAFIYTVTILTEYGYCSYFGIPPIFIDASIADNIIYFNDLINLIWGVVLLMKWQSLFFISIIIGFIIILPFNYKKTVILFIAILALILFRYSFNFGSYIGMIQKNFYVLSSSCFSTSPYENYIIPIFYQGKAILVPVDKNNKINGGFVIKDITNSDCAIEYKEIGKIVK